MVLWSVVAMLLVRGVSDVLASRQPALPTRAAKSQAVAWPDDAARAFAVDFTSAYLTYAPGDEDRYVSRLRRFVAPDVAQLTQPRFASDTRQTVTSAVVSRTVRVGQERALVTVAARLPSRSVATYLTVPIARAAGGGLTVYDLPSFAAAPAHASVPSTEMETMTSADEAGIKDVLTRFLRAFLSGRDRELEYFVPAGTRMAALAQPFELVGLDTVAQLGPTRGRQRTVLATVRARDRRTHAVYGLRYRLRLVRGDRWYVAAVNATSKEG